MADKRVPELLKIPSPVRFLSCEPLLGPINAARYLLDGAHKWERHIHWVICGGESGPRARPMHPAWARSLRDQCQAASVPFFFKQWGEWLPDSQVIEHNPHHWPRFSKAQFGTLDVGGEWNPGVYPAKFPVDDQECVYRLGKKNAGDLLDGREWHEFPRDAKSQKCD